MTCRPATMRCPERGKILTINANGIRARRQRTFLEKALVDLRIGVCVVTQTHLRRKDVKKIRINDYVVLADSCRPTPVGDHIGSGVVILVHANFAPEEIPEIEGLPEHLEHCSIKFYPTANPKTVMRISGVYITPTGAEKLEIEDLTQLSFPKKMRTLRISCHTSSRGT